MSRLTGLAVKNFLISAAVKQSLKMLVISHGLIANEVFSGSIRYLNKDVYLLLKCAMFFALSHNDSTDKCT